MARLVPWLALLGFLVLVFSPTVAGILWRAAMVTPFALPSAYWVALVSLDAAQAFALDFHW